MLQVQQREENVAGKISDSPSITEDVILDHSTHCGDYNFTNLADIKFEVESNIDVLEEQSSSQMSLEKDDAHNNIENTIATDVRMAEDPGDLMQIVNKEINLVCIIAIASYVFSFIAICPR